ncbi:MAG: PEGA domain-containing protein [Deltaproteobacteria bacterium]
MPRRALLCLALILGACHRKAATALGPEVVRGPLVRSEPAGAQLFIDGEADHRKTPCQIETWDPLVPHLLEVKLPGHVRFHRLIDGVPPAVIDARLPPEAFVDVDTTPPGATVSLGDEEVGKAPLRVSVAADEKQQITISLEGYLDGHADILSPAGATSRYVVELRRARTLSVQSDPPGARVTVDGVDAGVTPLDVQVAADATHRLRLRAPGLTPCEKLVRPTGAQGPTQVGCELGDAVERRLRARLDEVRRRLAIARKRSDAQAVGPVGETLFDAHHRLGIHDRADDEADRLSREVDELQGQLDSHRSEIDDRVEGAER